MDTTQKSKSTGHNYEEEKHNSKWPTVVYQKLEERLSQDSDGVSILKDVKLKIVSERPLILWKIRDHLITIKPDENLSSFLKRNPYTKHHRFQFVERSNPIKIFSWEEDFKLIQEYILLIQKHCSY